MPRLNAVPLLLFAFVLSFALADAQDYSVRFHKLTSEQLTILKALDFDGNNTLNPDEIRFGVAYKIYGPKSKTPLLDVKAVAAKGKLTPASCPLLYALYETDLTKDALRPALTDFEDFYQDPNLQYPQVRAISLSDPNAILPDPEVVFGLTKADLPTGPRVADAAGTQPPEITPTVPGAQIKQPAIAATDKVQWAYALWRSDKDLSLNDDLVSTPFTAPENAQPSQFSFQDDFVNKKDTFSARGIGLVQATVPLSNPQAGVYVPYLMLTPAVGFDRVAIENIDGSNNSKKTEVNNLDFKFGSQIAIHNLASPSLDFDYVQLVRLGFHQSTDFDFRKSITGAELDTQPLFNAFGSNQAYYIFGPQSWVKARWSVLGHVEGGTIGDPGTTTSLEPYSSFCRMGGRSEVDLWPTAFDNLQFTGSYFYYQTIEGRSPSAYGYDLNLTYKITKNFSVTCEYENDVQDFTVQKVHTVTAGIGILFP